MNKTLDFLGKHIDIVYNGGQWWIAIKPICNVLCVDYIRQFKTLQTDPIMGQLLSKQTTTGSDGKLYEMACLPEKYIYGWLFALRSDSPKLKMYKLQCYDVLYAHFHGTLTRRQMLLAQQAEAYKNIQSVKDMFKAALKGNPDYQMLATYKQQAKAIQQQLDALDADLMSGQLSIISNEEL